VVLRAAADSLCACASTASQPTLRRLILATDNQILLNLASVLALLPEAKAALNDLAATEGSKAANQEAMAALSDALNAVETSSLILLELVSQVKLCTFHYNSQ
jgi:hypothetical protein